MPNACSKSLALFGTMVTLGACVRQAPPPPLIAVHAAPTSSHTSSVPPPPAYDPSAASAGAEAPGPEGAQTTTTTTATAPPPADGNAATTALLPETLSRDDVLRAVHGVDARTRACGRGHPQTIMVQLTFSSSGELTGAEPQESARGSTEATCLVAALQAARTPPFRAPSLQMWVAFSLE